MEYKIVLETFEGPMDLLLYLIDKSKIDIYDIPINEITEQYINHLASMEELDLSVTGEFLVMAATLLEIKSKMLLPEYNYGEEKEEQKEDDPRLELAQRLAEYRLYKLVSSELRHIEYIQNKVYYKPQEDLSYLSNKKKALEPMDLHELVNAYRKLLKSEKIINQFANINMIRKEIYTIEECIARIKKHIDQKTQTNFSALLDDHSIKEEIIMMFLSILELIRTKYITIYQKENFADIYISKVHDGGV